MNILSKYIKSHLTALLTIALPLGGVGGFTSCADLEQTSLSSIDRDNFYSSKEDIETAVNGVYQEFTVDGFYGMFNNQSIYINDLQSDYVKAGAQTNSAHIRELSNFAVQPSNLFVHYAWEEHYTAINRANVVIDKLTDAKWIDDASRSNYINEARFLRALMYFNLVRYFGGVPIVLHDGEGEGNGLGLIARAVLHETGRHLEGVGLSVGEVEVVETHRTAAPLCLYRLTVERGHAVGFALLNTLVKGDGDATIGTHASSTVGRQGADHHGSLAVLGHLGRSQHKDIAYAAFRVGTVVEAEELTVELVTAREHLIAVARDAQVHHVLSGC